MKVCVCFCQRTLNALLGLRNPYKERLCTIKKLEGMDKRDQMLCNNTKEHACPRWLLVKTWAFTICS